MLRLRNIKKELKLQNRILDASGEESEDQIKKIKSNDSRYFIQEGLESVRSYRQQPGIIRNEEDEIREEFRLDECIRKNIYWKKHNLDFKTKI